jgi:hypothetical protein
VTRDYCLSFTRAADSGHSPLITRDNVHFEWTRIIGCTCGWRTPPNTADSDDALAMHVATTNIHRKVEREVSMSKQRSESAFNGVQVFCATMVHQRQTLGETVTRWLEEARAKRPGFQLVDVVVRQSSDSAFHCITIVIFFNEDLGDKEDCRG